MSLVLTVDDDLELRLVESGYAEELAAVVSANREHIHRWLPWATEDYGPDTARDWIELSRKKHEQDEQLPLLIFERGRIVGGVGFNRIEREDNRAWALSKALGEIGYWLAADAQGRGVMTRCVSRLLDHGFGELGLERVEVRAEPDNAGSCGMPDRLGFVAEGTLRRVCRWNGKDVDHRVYAVLAEQWRGGGTHGRPEFRAEFADGVTLRFVEPGDAPALFALYERNRERFRPYFSWALKVSSLAEVRRSISEWTAQHYETGSVTGVIEEAGVIRGMAYSTLVDRVHRKMEIGYWLDEGAEGRGLITRACQCVIDYGWDELGMNRIDIVADVRNRASQAVAERLGFTREAVIKQWLRIDGVYTDVASYRLLREDREDARP